MADQRFLNFIDMIDGGGAGRAGQRFEGGGLLSLLGNVLGIRPYGYEDRLSQMRPMARPDGLLGGSGAPRAAPRAGSTADYVGQHMDRNMVQRQPIDYVGQHMDRNMVQRQPIDYVGQHMDRNITPQQPYSDQDQGRIREFAQWFTSNYGPDVFGMLPEDVLQQKYNEWLNSRTGYRM